jgi:hypothetical protein
LPDSSLAGQEHGRTIPLADIQRIEIPQRKLIVATHSARRKSLV